MAAGSAPGARNRTFRSDRVTDPDKEARSASDLERPYAVVRACEHAVAVDLALHLPVPPTRAVVWLRLGDRSDRGNGRSHTAEPCIAQRERCVKFFLGETLTGAEPGPSLRQRPPIWPSSFWPQGTRVPSVRRARVQAPPAASWSASARAGTRTRAVRPAQSAPRAG